MIEFELNPALVGFIAGVTAVSYVVLIAAGQVLRRRFAIALGWPYHLFAVAFGARLGVHYAPRWIELSEGWASAFLQHLTAAVIVLSVYPVAKVLNRLLWVRRTAAGEVPEVPRVLADTTGMLVFVVVGFFVLQQIYGVKVPGLLAGSGVVAIILGLAMQDLLGNIFGGLAIYLEKPFKPGDWLEVEGEDARVVEVSWRSTRLTTNDGILIDMPNSTMVKGKIRNYQKPTRVHALRVYIGLHYDVPPERAQAVLREATASVEGVLKTPAPVVWVHEFADSSIVYDIKFWIERHRMAPRIKSEVRSHAWYAVRRAGMEIPFPIVTLNKPRHKDTEGPARAKAAAALRGHEIFGHLSQEHIDDLVERSPLVQYARHERVVEQGQVGDSMFLVLQGTLEVRIQREEHMEVVARLSPGACFGEMSLLTGEPRTATVVAAEEVELLEITHDAMQPIVQNNPDVLHRLSELLAQRQEANKQVAAPEHRDLDRERARSRVLARLRRFFDLG